VNAGVLDEDTVRTECTHAARVAGLAEHEIEQTINSALRRVEGVVRMIPERSEKPQAASPAPSPSEAPKVAPEAAEPVGESPWGGFPPVDGADWMFDTDDTVVELWGSGDDILWAEGEALMIAGGQGLGKSTLAGQLVRAQMGLQRTVLDLPVTRVDKPILYLAMDRPRQLRRSMRRQFSEEERDLMKGRLLIRPGPPIADLAIDPGLLARMAEAVGAGVVYVDSLKDAAVGLSTDEVGAMYNRARQGLLATGANVCELHHLKKSGPDTTNSVGDVYGSVWLTGGAGSVIMMTGEPGDLVVRFRHVKTPANEVGPYRIILDPDNGSFSVQKCNLVTAARLAGHHGLTAEAAAQQLYERSKPSGSEVKKAERQLERLTAKGLLTKIESGVVPVWFPVESRIQEPERSSGLF
jgi:replicative DNA helicase